MKVKKLLLGLAIGATMLGVSSTAEAKTKWLTIKVEKKSQINSASKKAWSRYKNNKPYYVKGKYRADVRKYVKKQIIKGAKNIKWVTSPETTTSARIRNHKKQVKYLSLIVKDLETIYREAIKHRDDVVEDTYLDDNDNFIPYSYKPYNGASLSEIKAQVIYEYFSDIMNYEHTGENSVGNFEKVYKGEYEGTCHWSSLMIMDIAKAWGGQVKYFANYEEDHAWGCMKVTNPKGQAYWRSISGLSGGKHMTLKGKEAIYKDNDNDGIVTDMRPNAVVEKYMENVIKSHLTEEQIRNLARLC